MVMQTTYHIKSPVFVCQYVTMHLKRTPTFSWTGVISFKILERSSIFPFLLPVIVTKAYLISEPLSDLMITTPNPSLATFIRIHWSIWSRDSYSCSFLNWFPTFTAFTITPWTFRETTCFEKTSRCISNENNYNITTYKRHYWKQSWKLNTYQFRKCIFGKVHTRSGDIFPNTMLVFSEKMLD